jgi:ribosome-associated protein
MDCTFPTIEVPMSPVSAGPGQKSDPKKDQKTKPSPGLKKSPALRPKKAVPGPSENGAAKSLKKSHLVTPAKAPAAKKTPSERILLDNPPKTRRKKTVAKAPSGRALADLVMKAASEHKVEAPVLIDLSGLSSVADWFFIASAQNSRQIRTVADKIVQRSLEAGVKPLGQEGLSRGDIHWALVDLGEVVAHIFNAETRAVYDLEGLWADAPRG